MLVIVQLWAHPLLQVRPRDDMPFGTMKFGLFWLTLVASVTSKGTRISHKICKGLQDLVLARNRDLRRLRLRSSFVV